MNSETLTADGQPALSDVVGEMLEALGTEADLPDPTGSLPAPDLSLVEVTEKPVGLGQLRGHETRGPLPLVALKGGRLDAVVRFQLWASAVAEVDAAILQLQQNLLGAREALRALGFLKLDASDTSLAEQVSTGLVATAWRKTASYRVLYEYHYLDLDGAESLITRIPVNSDPERRDSPERETTVVTGATVRWDNVAAPDLRVRGRGSIGRLSALVFLPGATPTLQVTLLRTFDGAPPVAPDAGTLGAFLAAVADPETRHVAVSFATLDAFLAELGASAGTAELSDWDEDTVSDSYEMRTLDFAPAIPLPREDDRLEVSYQNEKFDDPELAVLYLRLEQG